MACCKLSASLEDGAGEEYDRSIVLLPLPAFLALRRREVEDELAKKSKPVALLISTLPFPGTTTGNNGECEELGVENAIILFSILCMLSSLISGVRGRELTIESRIKGGS
jgi:hypothetical protein